MRKACIVLGLAFAVFATGAAPVGAATRFASRVALYVTTLSGGPGGSPFTVYYGNDGSARKACKRHRLNKVFRMQPGRDQLVGRDRGDRWGAYVLERHPAAQPGRYYTRLTRKTLADGDVCLGAKSKIVRIR